MAHQRQSIGHYRPSRELLSESLLNGDAVQIRLGMGKVYVGDVLEGPDPDLPTQFIKLQPLMSGQRGSDGQVEYTTFYDRILADFERDPATRAAVKAFQQVVPVDKVVTLGGFDLDAYVRFLADRQEDSQLPAPTDADPVEAAPANPWLLLVGMLLARLMR